MCDPLVQEWHSRDLDSRWEEGIVFIFFGKLLQDLGEETLNKSFASSYS